ncbi:TolC family protein [Pedobacter nyackensis]|uniref:Outer membrane protein TolC n=1 Tax=Pedobacter nyackensis TaxID=475255 RepID=A0A1W2CWJ9_9SPHI|nr:TolC family protein [Pedobacter nyackensis]SMC89623.1 Outer membrane protein TolC [Pedobacter nyackensis]
MKYTLQLTCLVLIAFAAQLKAQQKNTLTLKEAFAEADRTYPGLAERAATVGEYQIRKKEVQSRAIPQVQLQAQNSYGTFQGSSGAFFPVPGVFNVTGNNTPIGSGVQATGNTFGSVVMDWKVFEFGKQRKAIDAAEYQAQGAQSSYDAAQLSLHSKVSRLYLDIYYSHANLNWAEKNVKRVNQILDLSVSLSLAGLKPGADTALASSAYSQALAVRHEWLGKYEASKINFQEVVPLRDWSPQEQVPAMGDSMAIATDSVKKDHPYLQVIDKQLQYEKAMEQVASRKIFPSLSVLGGVSTRGSGIGKNGIAENGLGSGYQNFADNYLVGIGLTWNISGAYTSSLEKKRSKKTIQGVQAKYNLQRLQMSTSLQALSSRITQQQQLLKESDKAFKKASDAYELYLSRYESGLINLTELLQIQSLLEAAERENIQAGQNYWNLITAQAEISGDFSYLLNHFN